MRAARIALLPTVCWRWRSTCAATGTTVKPAATRAAPYDLRPPNAGLHILSLHPDSNLSSRKGTCTFRDMNCVSMSSQLEAFYLFHRCRGYSNWFDSLKDGVLSFLLAVSSILAPYEAAATCTPSHHHRAPFTGWKVELTLTWTIFCLCELLLGWLT